MLMFLIMLLLHSQYTNVRAIKKARKSQKNNVGSPGVGWPLTFKTVTPQARCLYKYCLSSSSRHERLIQCTQPFQWFSP